ncbi:MAG: HAD-IIIA family hydrolase [Pseudomonadota bacterium]
MRGAIFDLDGTLADTAGDLLAAANAVLGPEGLPLLDPVADKAYAGRGGRSMIRRSLEIAGRPEDGADEIALTDRLYHPLLEAYQGGLAVQTRLFDGVFECLDALEKAGWKLGVCTNKPEGLAVPLLRELEVAHRFGAILGADTLPVRKPDPEHFRETCRRISASPERSVMIGDTLNDLETARAAGVPCVLTSFGFAAQPLAELAPEAVVHHYGDIPHVLEALSPGQATG